MTIAQRLERWATNTIGFLLYLLCGQWLRGCA
jgi:hypothetical protein